MTTKQWIEENTIPGAYQLGNPLYTEKQLEEYLDAFTKSLQDKISELEAIIDVI